METVEQLRALLARRFDPTQPRNADGEWSAVGAAIHAAADTLDLAGRIDLGKDEHLVASGRLETSAGHDVDILHAVIDTPAGRQIRIGIVPAADAHRWAAADKGGTAVLGPRQVAHLHDDLVDAQKQATVAAKRIDKIWNSGGRPTEAELTDPVVTGTTKGGWADLSLSVDLTDDDPTSWQLTIQPTRDGKPTSDTADGAVLTPKDTGKLIKQLDGMASRSLAPTDGPEVARMHSADGGPSSASTGPKGGQFALGGGRVSAKGKTKPTHPAAKGRPAAKPAAHGPLGYDGKTGVGYGIKGGDPRVRTLQSVLNRLGLKDATGQTLAVDGKFGPRTTAAVKKLQQAMGEQPTGKVTEDFIKQVANLRALPPKPKTRTVKKPMRRSSAGTQPYGDVKYADPGYQPDGKERYPLDSEAHCRAAWSYINQADNAAQYSPRDLAKVKARIKAALKRYGVDVQDSARSRILGEMGLVRSGPLTYNRVFPLDDIQISRSGDGRTVEAYAATFDTPYEVRDQHGHYVEVIDRSAFNRTLNGAGKNAICVYNHGMTIHGTPDGMASLPLGKPLEIRPDGKGLLTVTRYNDGPWADSVLASIRNGDIKAQSFRGQIYRSSPNGRVPKRRHLAEPLPTVTRHELGLSDYGPTPTAVNDASAIVAVRSAADIIDAIQFLDADEREELLRTLGDLDTTPEEDPDDEDVLAEIEQEDASATSDGSEPGAEDPPAERSEAGHSGRLELQRAALRAELILKGVRRAEAA